MMGFCEKSI